ncbi:MAG TPA: sterol desaturase family protein [Pyrinomonadaceae bacterium]|nr:sterol desaturase family protein [Pyrinomonadaceae bacterium]
MKTFLKTVVKYGLYPFLLLSVVVVAWSAISLKWDYKFVYGVTTLALVISLILIETLVPLSRNWKMTKQSFFRDIKYIGVDIVVISLMQSAFGVVAIYYSENVRGLFTNTPVVLAVVGYLLVYEFFQYWMHRYYHEGKGPLGRFLGNAHLAHHLPDKVYVVMHAVFNPINAFISVIVVQTPLILLGIPPAAAFAASLLIDLQSAVSHFNVDIRAGFLNYIFIGTETHRYHHSADGKGAMNYGNTLSIWDIVFGTFYYKPNSIPKRLGVDDPVQFPDSRNLWQVVTYPLRNLRAG